MTSQNEIDQLYESASAKLDILLEGSIETAVSVNTEASISRSTRGMALISFVKETCNAKWLNEWALTHPVSTITLLNKIHQELRGDKLWGVINKEIQISDAYKTLQAKHPMECLKFLTIKPISEDELRDFTILGFFNSHKKPRAKKKVSLENQFRMAAEDFQTVRQVLDVRDEVRRRLVSEALIKFDFKTRQAALSIGCLSDGALVGNVRALFGTQDYRRETIEPAIRAYKPQKTHPFQPVIEDLVALGKLAAVEEQIDKFYPDIIMKAAKKCHFVKIRMANALEIGEKSVKVLISNAGLDEWYSESHKAFLEKTCEKVGYNFSQVATLLNVDVRYVTQQLANYEIEKPNNERKTSNAWPYQIK